MSGKNVEARTACSDCDYEYGKGESAPCPRCGSERREHRLKIEDEVEVLDHVKLLGRRGGFTFKEMVLRTKRSLHGLLARESLEYDKTSREETVKTHTVDEKQPDGSWSRVHDEHERYPAKERPE